MATTTGQEATQTPAPSDAPDGPGAFLVLAQKMRDQLEPLATIAALPGSGNYAGRRRHVLSTPGAIWEHDGTVWRMRGVPYFADAAARTSAIAAPVVGMQSVLLDHPGVLCIYMTNGWTAVGLARPSSLAPTGTSATISDNGRIDFTGCTRLDIVKPFLLEHGEDFDVDVQLAPGATATVTAKLLANTTVDAGTTTYNSPGLRFTGGGTTNQPAINAAFWTLMSTGVRGRMVLSLANVNKAEPTEGFITSETTTTIDAGWDNLVAGLSHEDSTAFDGIRLDFSAARSGQVFIRPKSVG